MVWCRPPTGADMRPHIVPVPAFPADPLLFIPLSRMTARQRADAQALSTYGITRTAAIRDRICIACRRPVAPGTWGGSQRVHYRKMATCPECRRESRKLVLIRR
jgi:hypothetical protein